jgi:hypothetical protein
MRPLGLVTLENASRHIVSAFQRTVRNQGFPHSSLYQALAIPVCHLGNRSCSPTEPSDKTTGATLSDYNFPVEPSDETTGATLSDYNFPIEPSDETTGATLSDYNFTRDPDPWSPRLASCSKFLTPAD